MSLPGFSHLIIPFCQHRRHWLWGRSKVRCVLMRLYEWAFDMHYRNS